MRRLLDVLDGSGINAYGTHYPTTGTVQLTLKGNPDRISDLLDSWFDALLPDSIDLEEEA